MDFNQQVDDMVGKSAEGKGYDGGLGPLWQLCKTLPHALGEIVYKVVRYHRKGNPEELVKIAAWARLEWEDYHRRQVDIGAALLARPYSPLPSAADLDAHVEQTQERETWARVPLRSGLVNVFCDWQCNGVQCRFLYEHFGPHSPRT